MCTEMAWEPRYTSMSNNRSVPKASVEHTHDNIELSAVVATQRLKESGYWNDALVFDGIDRQMRVCFKAQAPYTCALCQREHVKNSNRPCVFQTQDGIHFHCRSNHVRLPDSIPYVLGDDECAPMQKIKLSLKEKTLTKINPIKVLAIAKQPQSVLEYLNEYLMVVTWTAKPTIIELDYTNKSDPYVQRTIADTRARWNPIIEALDSWLQNPLRREVKRQVWIPFTLHPPKIDKDQFNLFTSFRHAVPTDLTPTKPISLGVQAMLTHLKSVWAGGDEVNFQYLIGWLAHKVQRPEHKIGVAVVIKSQRHGAGKGIVFDFFKNHVLGAEFCRQLASVNSLLSNFNGDAERSLLVCLDELGQKGGAYSNNDRIKDLITRTQQRIENKGLDARFVPDYNDYWFFTNNDWIVKVETSDRRYFCCDANDERANDDQYFKQLAGLCMNDQCGREMFEYLLSHDLSAFNFRKIPVTSWKRELREKSIDPLLQSVIDLVKSNLNSQETQWLIGEFSQSYDQVTSKFKKIYSNNLAFSKDLCKLLNVSTDRMRKPSVNPSNAKAGIKLTIPALQDKVREILKDPDYPFITESVDAYE